MRFSLIVCTRDRTDELTELLNSLERQNRADFETIIVDQNVTDPLSETIARFSDRLPIKHIRMTGIGLSRGRNVGLTHATGELIGFPDDDCRYLHGYLDAVDRVFAQEESVDCITGCPTAVVDEELGSDWSTSRMDLDSVTVLDRCQEFTVFVRRLSLRETCYNERLGVGAQTLWGADEGADFLIRLIRMGARLVFFPRLFVYHPNKISTVNLSTLRRALSYSCGRGCLFRLHPFPGKIVLKRLVRPAMGCCIFLLKGCPMRSAYYFAIVLGTLRGLLMTSGELALVRDAVSSTKPRSPIANVSMGDIPPLRRPRKESLPT